MPETVTTKLIIGSCAIHGKNFRSKEAYRMHMFDKHGIGDRRSFARKDRSADTGREPTDRDEEIYGGLA